MNSASRATLEPEPLEIDPRPCEFCGCTIDRHECVDTPEGPEFFCDDVEREIYLDATALRIAWEMDDPRDAWRHIGGPPPAPQIERPSRKPGHRTPQSVVDAFWFVVALDDAEYLSRWLSQHRRDETELLKIWAEKC